MKWINSNSADFRCYYEQYLMNRAIWYFDFVSPFAYLQNLCLDEFSTHLLIERKPLLFAGLLKHWDTKGPAELLPKRIFTYWHLQWHADRLAIPLRFPERHPFNPIPLLRLCIAAGCSKNTVDSIFRCVWEEGLKNGDNVKVQKLDNMPEVKIFRSGVEEIQRLYLKANLFFQTIFVSPGTNS